MKEYKVITLPLAEEDIADQTDYIAFELKSPETAVNMVRGFRKIINSLSLFPQSHELDEDEELAGYGIRKTYYKNYKIYFMIDEREQTVYILRVFHMLVDSKEKILRDIFPFYCAFGLICISLMTQNVKQFFRYFLAI